MISCLLYYSAISFLEGVYSKRTEFAPRWSKFCPLRVDSFSERKRTNFIKIAYHESFPFSLNILGQVHTKIYVGSFSFQSLLSHKYGYTAFPRVIEAEEFETIVGAMESQATKDLFHKYD